MEVQLVESFSVVLAGKNAKVLVNPKETGRTIKDGTSFVVGGEKVSNGGIFQVFSPGEYERSDVLVSAYQTGVGIDKQKADIFEINIDNVNVCFIGESVESLPESIRDEMGVIDILFLSVRNADFAKKMVNLVDPYIVVPLGEEEEGVKKFVLGLGHADFEKESKLKVKEEDFLGEEIPMRFVFLSK
ncbi:hypothetical protein JW796_00025 [Candidatus Dojkabacteria bacterium]|nr:hypothetical protein [Candidatus Dojkabacteria bacterium]